MLGKVTPESAISFVRLSMLVSFSYPLPITATRQQVIRFKIFRFLGIVNMCLVFAPTLMLYKDCNSHPDICIKSISVIMGCVHFFIQIGLSHGQYKSYQSIIDEMENYCKQAKGYEREILQRYVDKCLIFYGGTIIWYYLTLVAFIFCPVLLAQPFPAYAEYPFNVERQPLRTIIYIQQCSTALQVVSLLCTNILVAVLLWFAGARFDILSNEVRTISNIYELMQCIQKHQQVIRYANDVTHTVRFMVLMMIGCSAVSLMFCGITFISHQSLIIRIQFLFLCIIAFFEVFMCCWPANNLLYASLDVGQAMYESLWYFRDTDFQKNLRFILLRCQKPIVVSVACLVPMLSLTYYGSFITSAFSYFTALRIVFDDSMNEA